MSARRACFIAATLGDHLVGMVGGRRGFHPSTCHPQRHIVVRPRILHLGDQLQKSIAATLGTLDKKTGVNSQSDVSGFSSKTYLKISISFSLLSGFTLAVQFLSKYFPTSIIDQL